MAVLAAGERYGVCREHMEHVGRAPLPPAPAGRFAVCEVCGTDKTAGEPCLYCLAVSRATVSRSSVAGVPLDATGGPPLSVVRSLESLFKWRADW